VQALHVVYSSLVANLEDIARRYWKAHANLEKLRIELDDAIRTERGKGATYQELLSRSGYKSVETIRQIVKAGLRDSVNSARRARRTG
jgi:F0F1-type ATP synthase alpha subunit